MKIFSYIKTFKVGTEGLTIIIILLRLNRCRWMEILYIKLKCPPVHIYSRRPVLSRSDIYVRGVRQSTFLDRYKASLSRARPPQRLHTAILSDASSARVWYSYDSRAVAPRRNVACGHVWKGYEGVNIY